ncbi:MAG: hypothetical protein M1819_005901 [Sarea resinae]|nr:MAG: hypothetical protein M1819_005901 [Sarea resinae]
MEIIKSSLLSFQYALNLLLPFASPGTSLAQDVFRSIVLCSILYLALRYFRQRADESSLQEGNTVSPQYQSEDLVEADDEDLEEVGELGPATRENDLPLNWVENRGDVNFDPVNDPGTVPADPQRGLLHPAQEPRINARAREIGKKKAASLARRDQRRAYHEFVRSQGEAQRAREREVEEALQSEILEERRRRAEFARQLERKKLIEREERRGEEKRLVEEEFTRRKMALEIVRETLSSKSWIDIHQVTDAVGGGVSDEWLVKLLRAEGLVGRDSQSASVTMITERGFVVRVNEHAIREVCRRAAEDDYQDLASGQLSWRLLGGLLDDVIQSAG